jgi:predicted AlkP superfamily phosphohydrolase/phosphomutase
VNANNQVLMIGLDAADAQYVEQALPSLPNLNRLARENGFRHLDSPAGVLSASPWPTFYTGMPPGEHGYYYPMQWDAETMRLRRVTEDWLYQEPFWYELARGGVPVTAFDVQTEFPSRIAKGVEISNWGSQSFNDLHTNRPDLVKELHRRFGRNPMGPEVPARKTRRRLAAIRRDLLEGVRRRGDATLWLLRETDWRLFLTVFVEVHRAGHNLWPEPGWNGEGFPIEGRLMEIYQAVDREIGRLLEAVDLRRTTVIVFSLHGMQPNNTQMHFVQPVLDRINATFLGSIFPEAVPTRQRSLMRSLRERVPSRIQEFIGRSVSDAMRDWVVARSHGAGFDWSRTPGFALPTGSEGFIRCNLQGRERDGMLPPGSELHLAYLELIEREFLALRVVGTGAPLARDIVAPAEMFPGPKSGLLPDLCVRWHGPPASEVHSPSLGTFRKELETGRGGNHRKGAFSIISGHRPDAARESPLGDIKDFAGFVTGLL